MVQTTIGEPSMYFHAISQYNYPGPLGRGIRMTGIIGLAPNKITFLNETHVIN